MWCRMCLTCENIACSMLLLSARYGRGYVAMIPMEPKTLVSRLPGVCYNPFSVRRADPMLTASNVPIWRPAVVFQSMGLCVVRDRGCCITKGVTMVPVFRH